MSATAYLCLTFRRESRLEGVQLEHDIETYEDALYAHKVEDKRSVSGVAVCCGGTLVSWFSRTQKCVTLSTTEAEYVAMADGVKEALYVRGVLVFLMPSLGSPGMGVFEDDKVRIGDNHMIDVVGYGTLTVVFPGDLNVKLLDVAYMPELALNLFSPMAARKQGVGFMTEEEDLCISLFDGRLRFEGDGSSYSNFAYRI